jgi:LysR family transcriptional regulator, transcriptional activator of the cysJI operon
MLDAHQLNIFLAAATTLNFTAAARQLHMSQPSVSQHIRELEHTFGMALFLREGRHVALTDAGRTLAPLAQQLVTASLRIEETMQSLQAEVYGHLKVGCSTSSGKYVLPFLLADFMRRHRKVEATCHVAPRHVTLEMLCQGEVQLALAAAGDFCADVEYHHLLSDQVVLIAPLSHPWTQRREIEPAELLEAKFIMREESSGTRAVVAAGLSEIGLTLDHLSKALILGNPEAIVLAVQEEIGVAFVSQLVVERLAPGKVASVKVHGLALRQDIYIGRHQRHPATVVQTAFWEYVRDPHNAFLCRFGQRGNGKKEGSALLETAAGAI